MNPPAAPEEATWNLCQWLSCIVGNVGTSFKATVAAVVQKLHSVALKSNLTLG